MRVGPFDLHFTAVRLEAREIGFKLTRRRRFGDIDEIDGQRGLSKQDGCKQHNNGDHEARSAPGLMSAPTHAHS